jgi:hypothetical protein
VKDDGRYEAHFGRPQRIAGHAAHPGGHARLGGDQRAECETKLWKSTLPSAAEREAVMKRVLGIHTAVAKLARERAPAK